MRTFDVNFVVKKIENKNKDPKTEVTSIHCTDTNKQ